MSRFAKLPHGHRIRVFDLANNFAADPDPNKVNLGVGAYRTNEGKPWVFPVVRQAEKELAADETIYKEYLPVFGLEAFTTAATRLLLGEDSPALKENRAFGIQCVSGTGSLRVGAEFFAKIMGAQIFYYSKETWDSHLLVFPDAGFKEGRPYRYWCQKTLGLDLDGLLEDLNNAPEESVVILQSIAHNPTGCDPTKEQWEKIADVMEKRKLFPFFDTVYQGFTTGDMDDDAWSIRYFVSRGFELVCAQSFAKNFGLYSERVGNLTFVTKTPDVIPQIQSQITYMIRGMHANPPSHGARIIAHILSNPDMVKEWQKCMKAIADRDSEMRRALRAALEKLNTPGDWSHITSQAGMFCFTGLNEKQSLHMVQKHHVYLLNSGRISICGLFPSNVEYVAKAIHETVTNVH